MNNRTIVHFEIPAKNLKKLAKFYRKAFGWRFDDSGMPGMQYLTITTGPRSKSVSGGMYEKAGPRDRPRNYVGVRQINAAIRQFLAAGGKEIHPKSEIPGVGWAFIGADPEGNPIALFAPPYHRRRRRAATRR
jgi:uncharacterized protein